ncbi:MAG TPA: T9SS type A sorting domain-containing protein [Saprospiraceae bacterium]|nr:T9SS type A sorting domain-containing protein [Saprospiraceae bacterium]
MGNAVYEARMLLSSVRPIIVNEVDLCGDVEIKLENYTNKVNINVYPSPSNNIFNVIINRVNEGSIYSGKLFDLSGRIMKEFIMHSSYELPISNFDPGMYIISINQNPQWTTKVFIQK